MKVWLIVPSKVTFEQMFMTNESLFLFDANNDVFYVRKMFEYTLLLQMDTYYTMFSLNLW